MIGAAAEADGSVVTFDLAHLPTMQRLYFMEVVTRHLGQEAGRLSYDLRDIPEGTVKEEMKGWHRDLLCISAAVTEAYQYCCRVEKPKGKT